MSVAVLDPGPFSTIQDLGRSGHAHFGVPRSGAADVGSLRLANRLLGNAETAAGIECAFGCLALAAREPVVVAVTGAEAAVLIDERVQGSNVSLQMETGQVLRLGPVTRGLRVYIGFRGGVNVEPVLGSRSFEELGAIGPRPLEREDVLDVGDLVRGSIQWEPVALPTLATVPTVRLIAGPREDWLGPEARELVARSTWTVLTSSNRTGLRLSGPRLPRRRGDLCSEGVLPGAVQLPPDGQPIVLGPDAGVTGGYPVFAVVRRTDLDLLGQLAPGSTLRFSYG